MNIRAAKSAGFTLIELSIVLVIIGLIVGGILAGQDLIKAAEVRAELTQIEKYNQAVNTFYSKYGALPGDMPAMIANQFGFIARGAYAGQGDGNGVIEGVSCLTGGCNSGLEVSDTGEEAVFWVDLSAAGLIDGSFTAAAEINWPGHNISATTTPDLSQFLPAAKIGQGNYVGVYSNTGLNYFQVTQVSGLGLGGITDTVGITVRQAYSMDSKIDDGLPTTGRITANYIFFSGEIQPSPEASPDTNATCFNSAAKLYSLSSLADYGMYTNCALSFQMQGAGR